MKTLPIGDSRDVQTLSIVHAKPDEEMIPWTRIGHHQESDGPNVSCERAADASVQSVGKAQPASFYLRV